MIFFRKHWYDVGGVAAVCMVGFLFRAGEMTRYEYIVWLSLVSLLLHQVEEYRIVGSFPGMVNRVMYKSELPDRFPLNTNTAFFINVFIGWTTYLLAAIFAERAIWLGIATLLVSFGNVVAHTTVFNFRGKTYYNAGLVSCWVLFVPFIYLFFTTIHQKGLVSKTDYIIGIPLGIFLNVVGVLKAIDWLADKNTPYIFAQRNLLPEDRIAKKKDW